MTNKSAIIDSETRSLILTVGPTADASHADGILELFNDMPELGRAESIDGDGPSTLLRRFRIVTTALDSELLTLFNFYVPRESMQISPEGPATAPLSSPPAICPICERAILSNSECEGDHATLFFQASNQAFFTTSAQIARILARKGYKVASASGGLYMVHKVP